MSEIAKLIEEVVRLRLAGELKGLGFKKHSRTFLRQRSGATEIVNVQASQGNVGGTGKFTINVGIYLPGAAARLGTVAHGTYPKEHESTLRQRIGSLMPMHDDHWWHVDTSTDLTQLAAEVAITVTTLAIPWLDSALNPDQLLGIAAACSDDLTVAAIALELGQADIARSRVESAITTRPFAEAHFRRFAQRNQIPLRLP